MLKRILILSLLLCSRAAYSQARPAVDVGPSTLWVGGQFSSFYSDYDPVNRLLGAGIVMDLNVTPRYGIEGETRWLHWNGHGGQTQADYLGGPKVRLFQYHGFSFNAKFLFGGVWVTYPNDIGSGSYFAYAPGGFVDYRISRKFSVRGGYEYQFLPSAPGFGYPNNGLTPNGFSVGVTYRLLGVR